MTTTGNAVTLCAPINITAGPQAAGKPRRFDILAYDGGLLPVDGFPLPVVLDLNGTTVRDGFPILVKHENGVMETLGQHDGHVNDGCTLQIGGPITGDTGLSPVINHVLGMADRGHKWEASIGALIDKSKTHVVEAGESMFVNGRDQQGPFIYAPDGVIRETSVLPMGAATRTLVNLAAAAAGLVKGQPMPTFEEWVQSLGFDPANLTDAAKAALTAQYEAQKSATTNASAEMPEGGEKKKDDEPTNTSAAAAGGAPSGNGAAAGTTTPVKAEMQLDVAARMRQEGAAELQRQADIRRICAGDDRTIQAAIANNWTAEHAELQMLRASRRQQAPAGHVRSHDTTCTLQALQGAMILRAQGRLDHPAYQSPQALAMNVPSWLRAGLNTDQRQKAMEDAWRFRDMSMIDLAREACRLDGRDIPHGRTDMLKAAFSGGSLTNIFTSNVSTQILATYAEAEDFTLGWTKETEVPNFKTNERPRMTKGSGMKKLPRGGTADSMAPSDVGESFKIARFAGQLTIDEQDFIDDEFQAMKDRPIEMGNDASRLRPRLVAAIMLANAALNATGRSLFNSTDGNLDTGAALAIATLEAAVAAMFLFQENGVNLGIRATHLIVPASKKFTAKNLLQSDSIVLAGSTDRTTGTKNALADEAIKVVPSADLENGVIDPDSETTYAGSASTWFLAAAAAHTIEVAHRRGTGRAPEIRPFTLDKGQWGLGWDVNLDIGAKALDWKGLHKATA